MQAYLFSTCTASPSACLNDSIMASPRVGWGWMVRAMSSASAPISIAWTVSAISSPAPTPTIPAPSSRWLPGSNSSLVRPSSRPVDSARPLDLNRPGMPRLPVGHRPRVDVGVTRVVHRPQFGPGVVECHPPVISRLHRGRRRKPAEVTHSRRAGHRSCSRGHFGLAPTRPAQPR